MKFVIAIKNNRRPPSPGGTGPETPEDQEQEENPDANQRTRKIFSSMKMKTNKQLESAKKLADFLKKSLDTRHSRQLMNEKLLAVPLQDNISLWSNLEK